jgi:hypothetical protein
MRPYCLFNGRRQTNPGNSALKPFHKTFAFLDSAVTFVGIADRVRQDNTDSINAEKVCHLAPLRGL